MNSENEVRELESRRIKACCTRDVALLDTLYDASLTHVHMNGLVETRDELIYGLVHRTIFHSIERPNLSVRIFGDVAVLTGPMHAHLTLGNGDERQLKAFVTQVAKKGDDGWRFLAFHATQDTAKNK